MKPFHLVHQRSFFSICPDRRECPSFSFLHCHPSRQPASANPFLHNTFLSPYSPAPFTLHPHTQRHPASRIDLSVDHKEGLWLACPLWAPEGRIPSLDSSPWSHVKPGAQALGQLVGVHASLPAPHSGLCLRCFPTFSLSSSFSATIHTLASDLLRAQTISMGEWLMKKEKL